MASKYKIFEVVDLPLHGNYTHVCTVSHVIGINTENTTCLPNKKYMSVH